MTITEDPPVVRQWDPDDIMVDVLETAKTSLLVNGWVKGTSRTEDGSMCLGFALFRASKGFPIYGSILREMTATVGRSCRNFYCLMEDECPANISRWNDHPERTFDEVIGAIDKTINRLKGKK